ncbi:pepsin/retropepsin-like aspartic protease family protein [Undibacterium sp. JH2W]|uniref:pepsin/retropepsin-like aspartic protease family protein n=1 Tax=Undibacterium sp. JH2W TaxID=3413037 RepID=UPI003BF1D982
MFVAGAIPGMSVVHAAAVPTIEKGATKVEGALVNTKNNKTTASRQLLTSMFRKGNIYVKVSVNGAKKTWMMLDTGTASASIIDLDYAQSLGIQLTPEAEGTGGFGSEKVPTFNTSPVHLSADTSKGQITDFESFKIDGMTGPDGKALSGLLGYSFLAGKTLVIDYKKEEIYFVKNAAKPDRQDVKMELNLNIPSVNIKMSGHDVRALIDTGGAYNLLITPATTKEIGIEQYLEEAKPAGSSGHGGEQAVRIGKAPDISIGDLVIHDLTAAYTSFGTTGINAGASLGKDFLKNYKLTINYGAMTIRFEP